MSIAPQTIGMLSKVFCTSGPNLVVLAWTGDELSRIKTQNGVNFEFKFDLEGWGQSPPKTIGILNKVFYTWLKFGDPSLNGRYVIARTNLVTDARTDWRTDAGNNNTRRPKLASVKNLI